MWLSLVANSLSASLVVQEGLGNILNELNADAGGDHCKHASFAQAWQGLTQNMVVHQTSIFPMLRFRSTKFELNLPSYAILP
jgi:hypothetical protein